MIRQWVSFSPSDFVDWGNGLEVQRRGRAQFTCAAVFLLTFIWELGEYAGDRLLDTALVQRKRDSAEDIVFGTFGGAVGITFAAVVTLLRRRG